MADTVRTIRLPPVGPIRLIPRGGGNKIYCASLADGFGESDYEIELEFPVHTRSTVNIQLTWQHWDVSG